MPLDFHDPLRPGEGSTSWVNLKPNPEWPPLADQADALANPSTQTVAETLYQLLPSGLAWRTPDNAAFDEQSRLGGFLRGLAGDMARLYRKAFGVALESTASTLDVSLEDWEADYGLPDPCLGPEPARDTRLRFLLAKVRSQGTITPRDFIDVAAAIGYRIEIEEPMPWQCGGSELGSFDEVAGGGYEIGEPTLIEPGADHAVEYDWVVRVLDTPVVYFEAGMSQAGADALTEFDRAEDLECLFRALAPAWTRPIFVY